MTTSGRRPGRTARRRPGAALAPLALAAALLVGCGEREGTTATDPAAEPTATGSGTRSGTASETGEPDPSASAERGPVCADVWSAGATLPRGYDGCDDDGAWVEAEARYCEFGKPLVTHADRFWSVPGGRIGEADGPLSEDARYRDVLRKCSG